jgi:hypothetical protein
MKGALWVIVIGMLTGCASARPVVVRSEPAPTPEQVAQVRAIQTRVIATPIESVFPNVIDVLMDDDYVVRSADAKLGLVVFYQQWTDSTQNYANITQEGTALFKPVDASSTQVRVMLTGGWQQLENTGGGLRSPVSSMVGATQSGAADEYKKVLDVLQNGLAAAAK